MAGSNSCHRNLCTPRRAFPYGYRIPRYLNAYLNDNIGLYYIYTYIYITMLMYECFRNGYYDYVSSNTCNVAMVLLANLSDAKWPFWISFSYHVLARVSWLSSFEVSLFIVYYRNKQHIWSSHILVMISYELLFFRFHTSYGWLTFWDWFYGTDIEFQKTAVNKDRHFRIHSMKSAREIVPDLKSKSIWRE